MNRISPTNRDFTADTLDLATCFDTQLLKLYNHISRVMFLTRLDLRTVIVLYCEYLAGKNTLFAIPFEKAVIHWHSHGTLKKQQ